MLELKLWKKEQLRTLGVESEIPGAEEIRTRLLINWVAERMALKIIRGCAPWSTLD